MGALFMRCAWFFVGIILFTITLGCGQSQTGNGPEAEASQVAASDGPDAAVHRFLEAVRTGNDDQASQMLTPVARQKTAEYNMVVAPPGSDTASFKVGEVDMISNEGAHVASFWTDVDENGAKHTDTIIWMVRKEVQGWRIAGMATRVFDDKPALILNFEEPEDMLAQQQEIEEEMSRRVGSESDQGDTTETKPKETADTRNGVDMSQIRQRK
jgi:hypothetical protein